MNQQSLFAELQSLTSEQVSVDLPKQKIIPRPYQVDSVNSVFDHWESGNQTTLVCLPTGTGKSVVFSQIMRRFYRENPTARMLVLAHRTELIHQARQHAQRAGLTAGIEMANSRAKREAVIVSSIQTQNAASKCRDCRGDGCDFCDGIGKRKRMTRFSPYQFDMIVVDEAHHATADSYRTVLAYYSKNPKCKILLVTATPERGDGVGLHNVCDSVAYEMQLETAIKEGWLVPVKPRVINVESLDLSKVKKQSGDLQAKGVESAFLGGDGHDEIEEQKLLHAVARPTIEQAEGKPAIVFCAGQEHAEKLTAAFNAYDGVTAECVLDKTHKVERQRIIQRYKNGKTQILVNCMVFTEGFDAPATAVVANARPTKSQSLLLQIIGRGTRPLPGVVDGPTTAEARRQAIAASDKPHCVVIDFVGNLGRNQITTSVDLLAGDDIEPIDLQEALKVAQSTDREIDLEEVIEKVKAAREAKEAKEREEEERKRSRYKATNISYTVDEIALFLKNEFDPKVHYTPSPDGPSVGQVKFLIALGWSPDAANGTTKRQASGVISKNFRLPDGNAKFLFGKHAGKRVKECPRDYIVWGASNLDGDIQKRCQEFLERDK